MNLNISNLSHPRVRGRIDAAMRRAVGDSLRVGDGLSVVYTSKGDRLLYCYHSRHSLEALPGFSFYDHVFTDITYHVLRALRSPL